jgi:hypothetical protein
VREALFEHIQPGKDLAIFVAVDGALLEGLVEPAGKIVGHLLAEVLADAGGKRGRHRTKR